MRSGKYLHSSEPQFFDPAADPEESRDLLGAEPERARAHRDALQELSARPRLATSGASELDDAMRQDIAKLGYASVGAHDQELPEPLAPSDLPSPASRVEEQALVIEALEHFNAGRFAEATALHRRVLEDNPDHLYSLERLGIGLVRQRRYLQALEPLERVVESGRGSASAATNLAVALKQLGFTERATASAELALSMDPSQVMGIRLLIDLYERGGRAAEAGPLRARYEELTGAPPE